MTNYYKQQWPDLAEFMAVSFHEDMDLEYPASSFRESAKFAVEDFCRSNSDQVEGVAAQLQQLLDQNKSEAQLTKALRAMHCFWDFSPYQSWLESILEQINGFLKRDRGIPGKTSDDRLRRPEARSEVIAALPWVGLLACIAVFLFCLIWVRDLAHEANPNVWPLIGTFVGTVLVLAYLPRVSTRLKKTVIFSTLLVAFVMGTYPGLLRIANQAAGGVMHQIGSDASKSPQPQPPYSPSRVTAQQGPRPVSPRLNAAVEQSCVQRGFEGNWQWQKVDLRPGAGEYTLKSRGFLTPGSTLRICADAETSPDLHKLLVWVGAEPDTSGVSTWRPDSKSQKVWYVDKRIQFGFKPDAGGGAGGYVHVAADGELQNSVKVYVWIGMV